MVEEGLVLIPSLKVIYHCYYSIDKRKTVLQQQNHGQECHAYSKLFTVGDSHWDSPQLEWKTDLSKKKKEKKAIHVDTLY